jgi:hypothetical protein
LPTLQSLPSCRRRWKLVGKKSPSGVGLQNPKCALEACSIRNWWPSTLIAPLPRLGKQGLK